jgi:hypothetical protein
MRYEINTTPRDKDDIIDIVVDVYGDIGELILAGKTSIVTNDESVARQYAEDIFLFDIRSNDPKTLAALELPGDPENFAQAMAIKNVRENIDRIVNKTKLDDIGITIDSEKYSSAEEPVTPPNEEIIEEV